MSRKFLIAFKLLVAIAVSVSILGISPLSRAGTETPGDSGGGEDGDDSSSTCEDCISCVLSFVYGSRSQ